MLGNVRNYDPTIPKGKFGMGGFQWSLLLMSDFLFGLSYQKNEKGKVMRKFDSHTKIGDSFRRLHDKNVARLKAINSQHFVEPFPIPSIDASYFDKSFFRYWKNKVNIPIVVKGFLAEAPILKEASKEYFLETKSDIEVKSVKKVVNGDIVLGQNLSTVTSTFHDFLTLPKYEDHYINNFYGVLNDEDFQTKCYGDSLDSIQGTRNLLPQWFISRSQNSGSPLHCGGGDNMFLNIVGRKEWHFIDPSYSPVLQTRVSKNASYAISEIKEQVDDGTFQELRESQESLVHVPFYKCVLEEGDLLFNPPYWWHSVRNRSGYTVGCATRYFATKMNSIPINLCLYLDILKNPKNTQLIYLYKMMTGKISKKEFINIIFSDES